MTTTATSKRSTGSHRLIRALFDTNVLLDVLLEREPFVKDAAALVAEVEHGAVGGLVSAHTVTTVAYLVEQQAGRAAVARGVRWLLQLFEVAPVGRAELERALDAGFGDYEDAVLHEATRAAGAETIVTRNKADFGAATLPVCTPSALLAMLRAGTS